LNVAEVALAGNVLRRDAESGCTLGCTSQPEIGPELARVVSAWGTLPDHIQAAVLALVDATTGAASR